MPDTFSKIAIKKIIINLKYSLNGKGQGIVEFALVLAFCTAIGLFARDAGFTDVLKDVYDSGNSELLTAAIGTNNAAMWRKMDRDKLLSQVDNAKRVKADQDTLARIGQLFIGQTVTNNRISLLTCDIYAAGGTVKKEGNVYKSGDGIFLGNYYDDNTLDKDGNNVIGTKYNPSNVSNTAKELITEALTGTSAQGFQGADSRYFYSDEMVTSLSENPYGKWAGDRSIRVNFYLEGDKIDAVRVRINRGTVGTGSNEQGYYSYYGELDVTVKSDGTYKQTISNEALSEMSKDTNGTGRISVADSNQYNSTWYQ